MSENLLIVSGGSSGIGRAILDACPWSDARRIDVSRSGAAGCEHVEADLSDPASWPRVADVFERELAGFGGEHFAFFHCAGTLSPIGFAGETDLAAYARSVLLNSAAPQVLGAAFLRAAAGADASATGHLVNIGSGAAHNPYAGWSSYCGGKAAADHWIRTAGLEQESRGGRVRLVSIAPGLVETPMQEEIRATAARDFPDVERFVELHEQGAMRAPAVVAVELWGLLDAELENGAVLDLREL
jgi:benzil reductase ((S)-benzoin forming)